MTKREYLERLRTVRDFITGTERTALEIAAKLGCTKMSAYSLLRGLEKLGAVYRLGTRRGAGRGPTSTTWRLARPIEIRESNKLEQRRAEVQRRA